MAVDPQVALVLQWAQRSRTPPYPKAGVAAAREHYARASTTLDIVPQSIHASSDHVVELPGRALRIREYAPWPHTWSDPHPALLFFHGGGFTIGSIETHDRACRMLAIGGDCLVYSVEYRLAPEHRFPAAQDDAFDALAWLRREAPALGVDAERIAVGGDSAGGTLAAACAIHARDLGWPLALQLLFYPGLASWQDSESHRRLARGYLLDDDLIQWFFGNALRDARDRADWRFAPLAAEDLRGVAPAWIAAAEYDPLSDEDRLYAQRLRDAGVPVHFEQYDGMIHGFLHHAGYVQAARRLHVDSCAALREALAGDTRTFRKAVGT